MRGTQGVASLPAKAAHQVPSHLREEKTHEPHRMDSKELKQRRKRLMDMMGSNSIAILPTALQQIRNRDVHYPFRPHSDFFYLTGFPEPDAVAILIPDHGESEYILFCRDREPKAERWEGARAGLAGACERYGADSARALSALHTELPKLLANKERIYYQMGEHPHFDTNVLKWIGALHRGGRDKGAPGELVSLNHALHEMRLYKSYKEIKTMRQAAKVSAAAHQRAMKICRPGMTEYQLEAELLHEFLSCGARSPAYPSIIGSGKNGCILHYTDNQATMQAGELVLIDAGAELYGYASDISRTFPVSGTFSPAQRAIYEVVLSAQEAAIAQAKPGNSWHAPHDAAVECIVRGLVALGILKGRVSSLLRNKAYLPYYMHQTSHWLGLDVHDVGEYQVEGEWRIFESGMVLTIEPGLYMSRDIPGLHKKWWDVGIRVEDDILITRTGNEVMSKDAVKDPDAIEEWMACGD